MTTHVNLPIERIESLARALEEVDVVTETDDPIPAERQLQQFLAASELSIGEMAVLVGEILSMRKMAGMGSGVLATMRGSTKTVQERGFYKRLKFQFFLEIGSPVGDVHPKELDELAMRTWHAWGKKLFGEVAQLQQEIEQRKQRERN